MYRYIRAFTPILLLAALAACSDTPRDNPASPQFVKNTGSTVTYVGQGLYQDNDGSWFLNTELCGVENGAEVDGPYLLWVFTANGATSATITFNTGGAEDGTHAMTQVGNGTYKYVSAWLDPATLVGNVRATLTGTARNPQLVVSHGCRPFNAVAAWCSPGFWGHAQHAAFDLIGVDANSETFNVNVFTYASNPVNGFSGFTPDPTLITLLTTSGNTYKQNSADYDFPNSSGTLVGANAFNATGGYLTSLLPENPYTHDTYVFDPSLVGVTEACPIDNAGNWKETGN